jgi:hypothetical protein
MDGSDFEVIRNGAIANWCDLIALAKESTP